MMKSVNFDFSAKLSSIDYDELKKPTSKSLADIESEKLLVERGVLKKWAFTLFPIFALPKSLLFTLSHW